MTYLLDTDVVSELRRRRPDPEVVRWFDTVAADALYVSVLTIGEIRRGVEDLRRRDGRAAQSLETWLVGLIAGFGDHVVGVDAVVAERWGRLNTPDVERTGVSLLDPFRPCDAGVCS